LIADTSSTTTTRSEPAAGRRRSRTRGRGRLARRVASVTLAGSVLTFGAVYPWAYWPVAAASAVAGGAGLLAARRWAAPRSYLWLAAALALVGVAAAAQLVPLPLETLAAISPAHLTLLRELNVGIATGFAQAHPISLDPGATMRAVALYGAFALLLLGLARSLSERSADSVARVVTLLGLAVAVVGITQKALWGRAIYGIWTPFSAASHPFGPFVNKNHFAGWMLMTIPLALGWLCASVARARAVPGRPGRAAFTSWLTSPDAVHVVQASFAVLMMSLALAMTLSRSGLLSLALALIVSGYAALRRQRSTLARSALVGSLAAAAAATVVWAGTATLAARFAAIDTTDLGGRLPIWTSSLQMTQQFWLTGSGLNTYGVATLFQPAVVPGFHLREAHNDYLQLAVEGGLLLGIPVLLTAAAFVVAVWRAFAAAGGSAYWVRLGAVTGIVAVAAQSLVEFSLQIPANAVLFAVLCAVALHGRRAEASERQAAPERLTGQNFGLLRRGL
jgi:O-antigen ligase